MTLFKKLVGLLNGFRKLTICFLVVFVSTSLLIAGYITDGIFGNIMTIVVPSYFAGNVGEHLTNNVSEWFKDKSKETKKVLDRIENELDK